MTFQGIPKPTVWCSGSSRAGDQLASWLLGQPVKGSSGRAHLAVRGCGLASVRVAVSTEMPGF